MFVPFFVIYIAGAILSLIVPMGGWSAAVLIVLIFGREIYELAKKKENAMPQSSREYLERFAGKLADLYPNDSISSEQHKENAITLLASLKDVTPEMCKAGKTASLGFSYGGKDSFDYISEDTSKEVFENMIDAVLEAKD